MGTVAYGGSQWALIAAIAKLGTPEMVGQFSLALAITAPVFMFSALSLRSIIATDAKGEFEFGDYIVLRVLMTGLALVVITLVLAALDYSRTVLLVCAAVAAAKAVEGLSDVCYGVMQRLQRMDPIAHSQFLRGASSLAIVITLLLTTGRLEVAAVGLALSWAAVLLVHDVRVALSMLSSHSTQSGSALTALRKRIPRVRVLALTALPLGFAMMLASLNTNIPRYFVDTVVGREALGFYSAIGYLAVAGTTVFTALGQAASPELAERFAHHGSRNFLSLLMKLAGICMVLGVSGWSLAHWYGEEILTLLYTADYARYKELLELLMIAMTVTLLGSITGYGMTAMRLFRAQPAISVLVTTVSFVACVLLVPRFGLTGAVWSLIAAGFMHLLAGAVVVSIGMRRNT